MARRPVRLMHYAALCLILLLSGCFLHRTPTPPTPGMKAMEAVREYHVMGVVPNCNLFKEGMDFPDGSVVDQIDANVVVVIIPDPRSAEGQEDHSIPCR